MPPNRKDPERADWLSHFSETAIQAYVTGAADAEDAHALERHITACEECRRRLKEALSRSA